MHCAEKALSLLLIPLDILSQSSTCLNRCLPVHCVLDSSSNDPKKGLYRGPEGNYRLSLLILVLEK